MALEAVVYSMPQERHFGYSPYNTLPWCDEPCGDGEWDPALLASLVQDVGEWNVDLSDKGASPEREEAAAVCATMTTEVVASAAAAARRRKRRRTKAVKNEDEMESQRMTHIAVERNRRRQMNEYLAALRSLMPPSYAQRGDQASIVGGAINYVRELEQLLQSLEVHKSRKDRSSSTQSPFAGFFTFPLYSTTSAASHSGVGGGDDAGKIDAETTMVTEGSSFSRPAAVVADVEATMAEGHASVKVHAPRRRPRQLLRLATGLQRLGLTTLHLNVTAADAMVMYSFSLKVEDGCKIGSVEEIATAVHEILGRIQEQEQEGAGFS